MQKGAPYRHTPVMWLKHGPLRVRLLLAATSVRASNFAWLPLAIHSNCSEAVCLAARTLLLADLRSAFLRSVVIFVKYREVSTRTVLPNSIDLSAETALYSRFGGHNGRSS